MKKTSCFVMVLMLMALTSAFAAAESNDVTVRGDKIRGPLVAELCDSYFVNTIATPAEDNSLGEYIIAEGPGGTEKIHFSPKLVARLQKLVKNPRAGDGLLNICPSQARALIKIVGPMRVTMEPLIVTEAVSVCDKKGGCFEGKILTGSYQTLRPYKGIRMVSNSGNHKYPENSISFKIEYHRAGLTGWSYGTGWGPTIVLRNITMEDPIRLADTNANLIMFYLERITELKKGQTGNEGDSCWEVVILRDGTIYKDESPSLAPFTKRGN